MRSAVVFLPSVIIIATKRVINSLINLDLDQFVNEINKIKDVSTLFPERVIYYLLKYLNVNIIFDFNLKTSLIRANNGKTVLSK